MKDVAYLLEMDFKKQLVKMAFNLMIEVEKNQIASDKYYNDAEEFIKEGKTVDAENALLNGLVFSIRANHVRNKLEELVKDIETKFNVKVEELV